MDNNQRVAACKLTSETIIFPRLDIDIGYGFRSQLNRIYLLNIWHSNKIIRGTVTFPI